MNITALTWKISMKNSGIQMNEFRDGNLFFEIMQQEIWNKTQNDSTALLALYEKNKDEIQLETKCGCRYIFLF